MSGVFSIEQWEVIFRLVVAALLGSIIGWEREHRNKQAGLKTHLLVSLGSALIMLISLYGFRDMVEHPNARFDPARIAAQVVSGIGFLGAGAILRQSNMIISGLTTAATLWIVAAIGLSVGAGYYTPAVATVVLVLVIMFVIRRVESRLVPGSRRGIRLLIDDRPGILGEIASFLGKEGIDIRKLQLMDDEKDNDNNIELYLQIKATSKQKCINVMERLMALDGVKKIDYDE